MNLNKLNTRVIINDHRVIIQNNTDYKSVLSGHTVVHSYE
ncbi:hypothetical protein [Elizabethkingia anophelis]